MRRRVFKTVEGVTSPLAGSIPVRLRYARKGKGFRLPAFVMIECRGSNRLLPVPSRCPRLSWEHTSGVLVTALGALGPQPSNPSVGK